MLGWWWGRWGAKSDVILKRFEGEGCNGSAAKGALFGNTFGGKENLSGVDKDSGEGWEASICKSLCAGSMLGVLNLEVA